MQACACVSVYVCVCVLEYLYVYQDREGLYSLWSAAVIMYRGHMQGYILQVYEKIWNFKLE